MPGSGKSTSIWMLGRPVSEAEATVTLGFHARQQRRAWRRHHEPARPDSSVPGCHCHRGRALAELSDVVAHALVVALGAFVFRSGLKIGIAVDRIHQADQRSDDAVEAHPDGPDITSASRRDPAQSLTMGAKDIAITQDPNPKILQISKILAHAKRTPDFPTVWSSRPSGARL